MTLPEDLRAITPINFFQLSADIHPVSLKNDYLFPTLNRKNYLKYLLPDTSKLCGELSFADVSIGWCAKGIECFILVRKPVLQSKYPNVSQGDSVELFIDTRDVKTSGFNTKFCHHFFFLPQAVEETLTGEITHFRTDDRHTLCDASELKLKTVRENNQYSMQIFIPQSCLTGYDPAQFNRLGFNYRINRAKGFSQHFSVVSDDYHLEQQPSLWASLSLLKK